MKPVESRIRDNFLSVKQRVDEAANRVNREPDEITIVGVTKYVDASLARMLLNAGCSNLGESRPQVLQEKAEALSEEQVTWHLIGHLQRNKVARVLAYSRFIHSVDSLRLAKSIDRIAGEQQATVEVLLEVNISGEEAKHGFTREQLRQQIGELESLGNLRLRGLMGMGGLGIDEATTRAQFQTLRETRNDVGKMLDRCDHFNHLSMGMSADFEWAIEEGATMVRIGSVLFDGII